MGFLDTDAGAARRSMVEELETATRRLLFLLVVIPALVPAGLALGRATMTGLSVSDGGPVLAPAAAGTPTRRLVTLSGMMRGLRQDGARTEEYVRLYNRHVLPVETSLRRWGVPSGLARRMAWPLVEHSYARGLDPATVVAIVLVESSGRPGATSSVGARGLMQVMPVHVGHWDCGRDLYDVEANLCYGTHILAENLRRFRGDERRALLAYNGCVRGTNTPNCHTYPAKVQRTRADIQAGWAALAARDPVRRPAALSPTAAGP